MAEVGLFNEAASISLGFASLDFVSLDLKTELMLIPSLPLIRTPRTKQQIIPIIPTTTVVTTIAIIITSEEPLEDSDFRMQLPLS